MPRRLDDLAEIRHETESARTAGRRIGFVPTMGALHEGHASLIRRAREASDVVVVSIYVNPLQFGPGEDYGAYPRTLDTDLALCDELGVDLVMTLNDRDMYPDGFRTHVIVEEMTTTLCGRSRPDHFRGVTTVVTKLLNLARPHQAFFGIKDAQQALIIRRVVRDLNLDHDIEIVCCPTVREPDGLAMSSRNVNLSADERAQAVALSRGLTRARETYDAGERTSARLAQTVRDELTASAPLGREDYVDVVDTDSIQPIATIDPTRGALLAAAVHFASARLIDNVLLGPAAAIVAD